MDFSDFSDFSEFLKNLNSDILNIIYLNFLELQNKFDIEMSYKIFGEDLGKHLYDKWIFCDSNLLEFIGILDFDNKEKLFEFIIENRKQKI
jgi:hypothetical protein